MPYEYIDSPQQLHDLCQSLSNSHWLTLDTEFIREKTYFPQLCLLQIANEHTVACIDMINLKQVEPLFELLYQPSIMKILHAGGQDMEIFYHLKGKLPTPVFDTQIAAAFLNYGEQISYADLVHKLTGIKLDKAHTRANWAKRPLSSQQIQYAADDVRYLRDIYQQLYTSLQQQDRLQWMDYDLDRLSNPQTYYINPQHVWQRVKHCKKLSAAQLPILQALAAWREHYAIQLDKPRRWILTDEVLIELCQKTPKDLSELEQIQNLGKNLIEKQGDIILNCIAQSLQIPEDQWPSFKPHNPLSPEQKSLLQTLTQIIKDKSQALSINPTMLAKRKDLEHLILGKRNIPLLSGWRYEAAGKLILQHLDENSV